MLTPPRGRKLGKLSRRYFSLGVASSRFARRARAFFRSMAAEGVLPLLRAPSPEDAPLNPLTGDIESPTNPGTGAGGANGAAGNQRQRLVSLEPTPGAGRRYLPSNAVCNQKYSILSFLPLVLYEQFRMFYNLFFLLVALSQFIPALRVGFFWTYFGPLVFVLLISMAKEALDDLARFRRDRRINLVPYMILRLGTTGEVHSKSVSSRDIRVGDVLVLDSDDRVPADCVLLRAIPNERSTDSARDRGSEAKTTSTDTPDSLFIRTDQLDGETDWKLRRPVASTQALRTDADVLHCGGRVEVEEPKKEIYDFVGNFISRDGIREPLTVENTLWANTVVASGRAVCLVVYNGEETRSKLNASQPRSKIGTLDSEVNFLSKLLFFLLFMLSGLLTALRGFSGSWWLYFFRYFLLLSAIIPISMRVNLDMAKIAYSYFIEHDHRKMPGCTVRNSNLPEELGRVEYLLTDKTGTLTQNEMTFKKLHVGTVLFARDSLEDVCSYLREAFKQREQEERDKAAELFDLVEEESLLSSTAGTGGGNGNGAGPSSPRRSPTQVSRRARIQTQVLDALLAIALAHNVAPVEDDGNRTYEAASPDEVALVRFAESVGLVLQERSMSRVVLRAPGGSILAYDILAEFPFTSEAKRMGVIVQSRDTAEITLYVKGADSVVSRCVQYNDWLEEECGNLAREGLRTLVFAKRTLTPMEYDQFSVNWLAARTSPINRKQEMEFVQSNIETNMQLLALTGVEDRLQPNVRETLEKLKQAGIKIWMLTGDKVETATCIAVSSRLAERSQGIFTITGVTSRTEAVRTLSRFRAQTNPDVLIVDGTSLRTYLDMFAEDFMEAAARAPAAVACRCSPTQKADVVRLLQQLKGKRVAAIGDGGNDVSMIQQAHAGIGIPGKEGMQASLAADFSVTQFSHLVQLLLWHGRNSYKRSARLAQFVIHRGLIISIIQTVYCALFFYAAVSVYSGWILVGYATVFTMFPVFSLVLDEDVNEQAAETYPELYKDLQKGRALNLKTFLIWVFKSIYQGTMIMVVSVFVLWDDDYFTTLHLSAISFTSLIFTELLMVSFEVHNWHWIMILAQGCSVLFYLASILILKDTFDENQMFQWKFLMKVLLVTVVSCLPVTIGKWIKRTFAPAATTKLA